uniref:Nodulin-23 n=1 Tax=Glycine max TaxID=3847 RepID=NO23_SOYBN|nr:RecName: Full=Nodulin-23; Short=N-23; Flags: Precursor [Glycine max]CAA25856.1 nodulin-23 [Glycine max]
MRVIVITVFLFIGAAIAEDVGIGLLSEAEAYVSPKLKKFITPCTSHVGETCSTTSSSGSEALMQNQGGLLFAFRFYGEMLGRPCAQLYQTSVTNLQVEPSEVFPRKNNPQGGRKSKLDDHQVQPLSFRLPPFRLPPMPKLGPTSPIIRTIPSPPIAPRDLSLIETIQLRTALRTCTHVTARTCLTAPNVATSDLEACLTPSMNQCIYPRGAEYGSPPIRA